MLFRMSAEAEARRLAIIGLVVLLSFAAVCYLLIANPFGRRAADEVSVVLELPYVGQGVGMGTPLMMHGVTVGKVAAVTSLSDGNVRLTADLQAAPIAGLTDTFGVDFRPANYFGVTGINLVPGSGGHPLHDGTHIVTVPLGNFTLQALLSRLGEITGGVVTPQLVDVVNKATRYTDGLNPLIESMLTAAGSVTKVQTVSTEQLLRNTAGISVAFPSFVDDATAAGYSFNQGAGFVTFNVSNNGAMPVPGLNSVPGQPVTDDYWNHRAIATLDVMANSFFGALGKLLSSHVSDLLPAVNLVQTLTDPVPGLVTPDGVGDMLVQLRTRFEKLYGGTPEQRALQVHIVLDQLPGVQSAVNAVGTP